MAKEREGDVMISRRQFLKRSFSSVVMVVIPLPLKLLAPTVVRGRTNDYIYWQASPLTWDSFTEGVIHGRIEA